MHRATHRFVGRAHAGAPPGDQVDAEQVPPEFDLHPRRRTPEVEDLARAGRIDGEALVPVDGIEHVAVVDPSGVGVI